MNFNVSSPGSSFLLAITEHSLGEQETRTSLLASGLRKTTVVDSSRGDFSLISNISTLQMPQICLFFFPIFQHYFQYFKYLSTKENIILLMKTIMAHLKNCEVVEWFKNYI